VQAQERLKILFESAPDTYYLHDLKGIFLDGNQAAEELTGYPREIGKSFLDLNLLSPQQIPRQTPFSPRTPWEKILDPRSLFFNRKGGGQVTLELSAHPVKIQEHRERNACAA